MQSRSVNHYTTEDLTHRYEYNSLIGIELKTSEEFQGYVPILYASMFDRCKKVIEKEGGCLKY